MSYKTIHLVLLSLFFQNICIAQKDSLNLLIKLQYSIDSIVNNAINQEAFPGCVVYASLGESPFIFKSYGFHTYDSLEPTYTSDIFDLASITKVASSTLAFMKLYDDGLVALDVPIKNYINGLGWHKIRNVTIRECLSHQSGLKSWIKYYDGLNKNNGKYRWHTLSKDSSESFPYKVREGLFLHKDFYKKIKKMIRSAPIEKVPKYVYSGLFFYLVPELVQNLTGEAFDSYLNKYFYQPMKLNTTTFEPLNHFPLSRIIPTEIDTFFRNEPTHGKVHDEGAILMKGISGNAGLFSDAEDLASIGHLLLNRGIYKGDTIISPATVDLFTTYQYPNNQNRRGLGFDKPLLEYDSLISSVAKSASHLSYGHTGYTGTLIWVEPKYDFTFIFLSNRVYPDRTHRALYQLNVRPTIHQLIYEYLEATHTN